MRIKRLLSKISITVAIAMAFTMVTGMNAKAIAPDVDVPVEEEAAEQDFTEEFLEDQPTLDTDDTYTVTFRRGNVGTFKQADGDNYAVNAYRRNGLPAEWTQNGSIKVTVPAGGSVSVPAIIDAEGDYYFRGWKEDTSVLSKVTKNEDMVLNFGRLVDAVEYQVRYVIQGTDTSVRPPVVRKANVNDEFDFEADANIAVSAGAYYVLQGEAKKHLKLDADAANNIITFEYVLQDRYAVTSESTLFTDGGTVTTVEGVTVPGAAAPAAGGGGGAAPAAVAPAAAAEEPALTNIDEGQTALAASIPESPEEATTNIEEPATPLDANLSQTTNLPYLILTGALIAAIAVGFYVYTKKNPRKQESDGDQ